MRRYETIFIVRPSLGEDDYTSIIDRTSGIIKDFDGTMLTIDKWGLKKLAYDIKKETQGFYVYLEYASTPDAVNEIERIFRIEDKVLKYLTIKLDDHYTPGEDVETTVSSSAPEEPAAKESETEEFDAEQEETPEKSAPEAEEE